MAGIVYLIRGLPGSGKSTLARNITPRQCAADNYFEANGAYSFSPELLGEAHSTCRRIFQDYLYAGEKVIAVHNTFSTKQEIHFYLDAAKKRGYNVMVIDLFDAGLSNEQLFTRNVHKVPLHAIERMRARWEHFSGIK